MDLPSRKVTHSRWNRFKRKLKRNTFLRNVMLVAGGTALSQLLGIVSSPILTHLYSPESYGILTVYITLLSILSVVASWVYEQAIPLPEEDEVAANLLVLSFGILFLMGALLTVCVVFFGHGVAGVLNAPQLQTYLYFLPISLIGAGAYQAFSSWAIRRKQFGYFVKTRLYQSIAQIGTQIGLGLLRLEPLGLIVGDVMGRFSGNGTLWKMVRKQDHTYFKTVRLKGLLDAAKRYKRFPLYTGSSTLLNSMGLYLPILFLTFFYGTEVVGWYSLSQRVLGLPFGLISTSVTPVFYAEFSQAIHEDPKKLKTLYWKVMKHFLIIGLPITLLIIAFAPWVISVIFGAQWEESGVYLQALAVMYFLQFIAGPLGNSITALERQELHLLREVIRMLLLCLVVLFCYLYHFSSHTAVLMLSGAMTFCYILHLILAWYAIIHFLQSQSHREEALG